MPCGVFIAHWFADSSKIANLRARAFTDKNKLLYQDSNPRTYANINYLGLDVISWTTESPTQILSILTKSWKFDLCFGRSNNGQGRPQDPALISYYHNIRHHRLSLESDYRCGPEGLEGKGQDAADVLHTSVIGELCRSQRLHNWMLTCPQVSLMIPVSSSFLWYHIPCTGTSISAKRLVF